MSQKTLSETEDHSDIKANKHKEVVPRHCGDPLFIPVRVSKHEAPQSPQPLAPKTLSLMRVISDAQAPPNIMSSLEKPNRHVRSRQPQPPSPAFDPPTDTQDSSG